MHTGYRLLAPIDKRFGTWRGLLRTVFAQLLLASGKLEGVRLRHPGQVRRIVFVCRGNICRSSFAHHLALAQGLPAASVGLETRAGARAPRVAIDAAARAGVDMRAHRTTRLADFEVRPGDLFLAMEPGQTHALREHLRDRPEVFVSLLGMWCTPGMPHLHDPFGLDPDYFDTVYARIGAAVAALAAQLRAAAPARAGAGVPA